jgi:hypothetical protein
MCVYIMCVQMYVCMYIYVRRCVYVYIYIYVYMCVCVYIYIYCFHVNPQTVCWVCLFHIRGCWFNLAKDHVPGWKYWLVKLKIFVVTFNAGQC